jgi:hypothetical protein
VWKPFLFAMTAQSVFHKLGKPHRPGKPHYPDDPTGMQPAHARTMPAWSSWSDWGWRGRTAQSTWRMWAGAPGAAPASR